LAGPRSRRTSRFVDALHHTYLTCRALRFRLSSPEIPSLLKVAEPLIKGPETDLMQMGMEAWSTKRQAFIFRCSDARKGDRWTFVVSQSVLEELHGSSMGASALAALFDALRPRIYQAAQSRMMTDADPTAQQVLSADDIREVP